MQNIGLYKELQNYSQNFLDKTFASTWTSNNTHAFRISSFPYCPIMDLYERTHKPHINESVAKEFYTSIGTAVHESVMQENMKRVKKLGQKVYGNWKCRKTGKTIGPCFLKYAKRQLKTDQLEYVELQFKYKDELSGHLDMLTKYKGKWVAWEFKTTGDFLFSAPSNITKRYYPDGKHKIQIRSYGYLLYKLYGIKISAYNIIYISRDRVDAKEIVKSVENLSGKYKYRCYTFLYDFDAEVKQHGKRINQAVNNRKAVQRLVNKDSEKAKDYILDHKPCGNSKDYLNYMTNKFFNDDECPYYKDGSCFKAKKIAKIVDKLSKQARK